MNINRIDVVGIASENFEFSHEFYGERFYKAAITVNRLSGGKDTLIIVASDRVIDITIPIWGRIVSVGGEIRTYNTPDSKLCVYIYASDMDIINSVDCIHVSDNNVVLSGYICKKNSSCRRTPLSDRVITDFILANNKLNGKSNYIPCVAWNKDAVYVDGLDIGSHVLIRGRFQSRIYSKNGERRVTYEVSIKSIQIITDEKENVINESKRMCG